MGDHAMTVAACIDGRLEIRRGGHALAGLSAIASIPFGGIALVCAMPIRHHSIEC
jgi:hypothetical protein